MSLDNRWSNVGGTFKLYRLNGATNSANVSNSESFMSCRLGTQCYYRNGQAVAVKTTSATVRDTGLAGKWSVVSDKELQLTLNSSPSDLLNFASISMHWGETCQNDVIEGTTRVVSTPGSLPLLALGLCVMLIPRGRLRAGKRVA